MNEAAQGDAPMPDPARFRMLALICVGVICAMTPWFMMMI